MIGARWVWQFATCRWAWASQLCEALAHLVEVGAPQCPRGCP